MKKVSVIIPVYNVEKYLSKCLESVLNQTYKNVEIIIIEDKSTDDSRLIALEYQRLYPNIKIILNEENRGVSYCRNRGIRESTGELISFIDSDDVIDKNFLESIISAMERFHTDIGMCGFSSFIKNEKEEKEKHKFSKLKITEETLGIMKECCWNKVYRRSLIDEMEFRIGTDFEDFPFTYPMLIKSGFVAATPSKMYHHRRNFKGISLRAKLRPNRGILDIYSSAKILERNYSLVRKDQTFDNVIKQIEHIEMLKMACDASLWQTVHVKKKKRIVSMLYHLANRYFGYFKMTENPLLKRKLKREFLFQLRILILLLNKNDEVGYYLDDDDILCETGMLIDECRPYKCKVKEK